MLSDDLERAFRLDLQDMAKDYPYCNWPALVHLARNGLRDFPNSPLRQAYHEILALDGLFRFLQRLSPVTPAEPFFIRPTGL